MLRYRSTLSPWQGQILCAYNRSRSQSFRRVLRPLSRITSSTFTSQFSKAHDILEEKALHATALSTFVRCYAIDTHSRPSRGEFCARMSVGDPDPVLRNEEFHMPRTQPSRPKVRTFTEYLLEMARRAPVIHISRIDQATDSSCRRFRSKFCARIGLRALYLVM